MKKIYIFLFASFYIINFSAAQVEKLDGIRIGAAKWADGSLFFSDYSGIVAKVGYHNEIILTDDSKKTAFILGGDMTGGIPLGWDDDDLDDDLDYTLLLFFSGKVGFRSKIGFEFNIGCTAWSDLRTIYLSPIISIGQNLRLGYINLPLNLEFMPSITRDDPVFGDAYGTGSMITFTVGFNTKYALFKKRRGD